MKDETLVLTTSGADSVLTLAPGRGGAVLSWQRAGRAVLREPTQEALDAGDARGLACYPLVPYSNRIAYGRFGFAGTDYQIAMDDRDRPHAIHGVGWARAWQVAAVSATAATLRLQHPGDADWPFAFVAEQHFELAPDGLTVTISITNRHPDTAPAGIGLHPFFPHAAGSRLMFSAGSVWEAAPDLLPSKRAPIAGPWDHSAGKPLGPTVLDNCFNGWTGRARIVHDDRRCIAIGADAVFSHLVVYVPQGEGYCAVEPVSHMNDGLNHMQEADNGIASLAPGDTLSGAILFELTGW